MPEPEAPLRVITGLSGSILAVPAADLVEVEAMGEGEPVILILWCRTVRVDGVMGLEVVEVAGTPVSEEDWSK